ncbi:hypothetical protein N824_10945 [Pedobacter sp. V48]|nr:hypothetical protein N824_10945 [Pedobacter sp. V48]
MDTGEIDVLINQMYFLAINIFTRVRFFIKKDKEKCIL